MVRVIIKSFFFIILHFSCSSLEKIPVQKESDFRNPLIRSVSEKKASGAGLYVFQIDSRDSENERFSAVIPELHRIWKRAGGRYWSGAPGEKIPENTAVLKTDFESAENEISVSQKLLNSESSGVMEFGFRKKKNTGLYAYIHDKTIKNNEQEKFETFELYRMPGTEFLKSVLSNASLGILSVRTREKNAKISLKTKNSASKRKIEIKKIPSEISLAPGEYSAEITGRGQKKEYTVNVYPGKTTVLRYEPYAKDRSAFFYSNDAGFSARIGNDQSRMPASFVRMNGTEEKAYVESRYSGRTSIFLPAEESISKYLVFTGQVSLLSEKNSFIWKTDSDPDVETEMKNYLSFVNHTKQFRNEWSGKISHYFVPENAELNAELFEISELGQGTCFLGISFGNHWYGFLAEEDRISTVDTLSSPKLSASYRISTSEVREKRKVSFRIIRAENRIELFIAGEQVLSSWINPDLPFRIGVYSKGGIFNRISFLRTLELHYDF